ncbi:MAG: DUF4041 domain-containing protein [Phycisphaerae bacterium]|nr:DUF4041 domain-containing protein [Phycisphaerae bacterium]
MVMPLVILLVVILAVVIYLLFLLSASQKQISSLDTELSNQKTKYQQDIQKCAKYISVLKANVQRLAKWASVADADTKAQEMVHEAKNILDKATTDAHQLTANTQQGVDTLLATAKNEANTIASEAKQQAKAMKDETQATLDSATTQAKQIIDIANIKAKEIAGGAYEIMKNATLYEHTAKAMKNIIRGYGDQYIIPTQSLLDDLAEDFGHTQAGQALKAARECTKTMIRNNTAATCEYVEMNRRDTAINFVVDAFNGKVDSILSRVRHDNVGTLEQEIRDAFAVVNYNGKAFREARITEEYLNARINELKWATIAQELKLQEREEQRRIKEQIREEEKAQREYEQAKRDAVKEEEILRKAMENARQQIEKATSEQKTQYEQQLQELSEKLKQAEERNQRAISMAQQTKRGHVYIISNVGSFGEDVYKIGLTRRWDPLDRVKELGDSSVPFEFDVHALISSEDAPALECQLHKHFVMMQMNKVNHRKEFFKVDLKHIREEVEKFGLTVKWTMMAEAREYRESLSIEKAIKETPALREAWLKRQLKLEPVDREISEATMLTSDIPTETPSK